jgi:hypothetical protein
MKICGKSVSFGNNLNADFMKLKAFVLGLFLFGTCTVFAQGPAAQKYGSLITESDLKENLSILSSDAMEGRETGTRGQKMAAAFIAAYFEELGLTTPVNGSYFQPVELYKTEPGEVYVKVGQTKHMNFENIAYSGSADSGGEISMPVVFAGKGREEDFAQVDVTDKAALVMLSAEDNFRGIVSKLREKGAKLILVTNANSDDAKKFITQFKAFAGGGRPSAKRPDKAANAGSFIVTPEIATQLLNGTSVEKLTKAINEDAKKNALKKLKPGSITFKTTMNVKTMNTANVLGYLEGSDKKDEVIVVTAHYDHIGKLRSGQGDLINNGADDDGSGTVSVLQLAKVFTQAKKDGQGPRRSMLFMTVTGEEQGLLGSAYYAENPVYPLDKTVVDLNIDMIGRRDAQHKDSAPYVYVIGSDKLSTELHQLSESINKANTNLIFDYTYNDQNHPDRLYYRSDHWNFAKNNIPIIFYFDGIHEDYHRPTDQIEKIEFDLLAKRAQCVFYTAWEIANRDQRIMPDAK